MEHRPSLRRAWLLLVLLTLALRFPAIVHPMTVDDEGGYAVVAHELLEDGTLYQSALDRRPPLLFWIYAAVFRVVGPYN
jgi:4-amino-4-deoxy-L-arabinose transferase-like glycosyltransferase